MKDKMEKMMKMMDQKKSEKMSDQDISAKKDVLQELLAMCNEELKGRTKSGLDGMKKVSVMSDTADGLTQGLEKAHEISQDLEDSPTEELDPKTDDEHAMDPEEMVEKYQPEEVIATAKDDEEPLGYFARKKKAKA